MSNLKISTKVILSFVTIGCVSLFVVGLYSYFNMVSELREISIKQIIAIRDTKKQEIETYFNNNVANITSFSSTTDVKNVLLQIEWLKQNTDYRDSENLFLSTNEWKAIYKQYNSFFTVFSEQYKYFDTYLINTDGQIVFSCNQTRILGESLKSGRLSKTNLAALWESVVETGKAHVSDFGHFALTGNEIFAFAGIPVFNEKQEQLGVIITQFDLKQLNQIASENTGFENGEILIFGDDDLLRCNSASSGGRTIKTTASEEALNGITGNFENPDYKGINSFIAFSPIFFNGLKWGIITQVSTEEVFKPLVKFKIYLLVLSFILILCIFGVGYIFAKRFTAPVIQIRDFIVKLGKGIHPSEKFPYKSNDENSQIGAALEDLTSGLKKAAEFAHQIETNNLKAEYTTRSDEDVLGNLLLNIRTSLSSALEEEEKRKKEDEIRNWANEGYTKFTELLRQNNGNIIELAEDIITNIIHYLEINQGGLFIYNDEEKDNLHLELIASYAFDRKRYLQKKIKIGEGIIGNCALEKATVHMTKLPENYIEITSGLGNANPDNLLIVPLIQEEQLMGIIELASFTEFQPYQVEFIERIAESIAVTLYNVKISSRTSQLLEESRFQAENMAAQEEEMRQNLEEMEATREEASRKEQEMNSILSAFDYTLIKGEFDVTGRFISVNEHFFKAFELYHSEIVGSSIRAIIPEDQAENFNELWNIVAKGEIGEFIIHRKNKFDKDIWLHTSYAPIKGKEGKLNRILFLANDITEQKILEKKAIIQARKLENQTSVLKHSFEKNSAMQKKQEKRNIEIENILQSLNATFVKCEFEPSRKLISANKNALELLNMSFDDIKGEDIDKIFVTDSRNTFFQLWQNVCKGNSYSEIHKIFIQEQLEIWLIIVLSPIIINDQIVKINLFGLDITDIKSAEITATNQTKQIDFQLNQAKLLIENMQEHQNEYIMKIQELEKKENKVIEYKSIISKFDTEVDKRYEQWLNSIEKL